MMSRERLLRWTIWGTVLLVLSLGLRIQSGFAQQDDANQVYRIVILENQTLEQAQRLKGMLESWGFLPVQLERTGDFYRVMYGVFPAPAIAQEAMTRLKDEGISAQGVVAVARPRLTGSQLAEDQYTVIVQELRTRLEAEQLLAKLKGKDFSPVEIQQAGRFFRVTVGRFSLKDATMALGQLRTQGYTQARVSKLALAATPTPSVAETQTEGPSSVVPQPDQVSQSEALSPAITQTDLWKQLSEEQKRQVINSVMMQRELRKGDALAEQVVDINTRLKNLDDRVKTLITKIDEEKTLEDQLRGEIEKLYKDADNFARAGQFQEAINSLRSIINLDKEDRFNQRQFINRRIATFEQKLTGESYEGQSEDLERQFQGLKAEAEQLGRMDDRRKLEQAVERWWAIARLDNNKYGPMAQEQINRLENKIQTMVEEERKAQETSAKNFQYVMLGGGGALVLMLIMLIFVWMRGRKRHMELMTKVQEITSIRPMRELQSNTQGLLEKNSPAGSDSDIFAPQTPGSGDDLSTDPLGGLAPQDETTSDQDEPKDSTEDQLFGGSSSTPDAFGGGDMGFDDIFGSTESQAPTQMNTAGPTESTPDSSDDTFSGLFGAPAESAPAPQTKSDPTPQAVAVEDKNEQTGGGAISFDDLLGAASNSGHEQTGSSDDLLSIFDQNIGEEESNGQQASATSPAEMSNDNPFADILGSSESQEQTELPSIDQLPDDTEIPAIRLDLGGADSAPSFDEGPQSDNTSTSLNFGSNDLPSFSFDDVTAVSSTAHATGGASGGIELDFEDDTVGEKPAGWEGDYDFAALTVKGDSPVSGAHQYLCFEKREGAGKAFYSYRFPEVSGMVTIEFDLRCNDKNKFLLGFYIEKDGDFQNSIHTKILRSEAQTTPTIHMQGESAPYLLGSWAHIKYMVDLNAGVLNGYIDGTHVARNVDLQANPGSLNTLSIRDNINTTGVLLLDNIKVTNA